MSTTKEWPAIGADAAPIERATVIAVDTSPEHIRVRCLTDEHEVITCDVLQAPARGQPVHLAAGDWVLVWRPGHEGDLAVVLGRIGREPAALPSEAPDELVLEAKQSLTLRVGDGSITIREDGKILIKGNDLVSHAKRLNRIKGGAVQIN